MPEVIVVRADGSRDVSFICEGESLTKQSEAPACDINRIMAKYEKSGIITHLNENPGFFADVSSMPDYMGALAIVDKASAVFAALPAELRARFENNPALYLEFATNPANREEMITLGMINPPPPPVGPVPPIPVVPAAPAAAAAAAAGGVK